MRLLAATASVLAFVRRGRSATNTPAAYRPDPPPTSLRRALLYGSLISAIAIASPRVLAQQPGGTLPRPDTDYAEPEPQAPPTLPATAFVMPDLPDDWNRYTSYDGPLFATRFNPVVLLDHNAFTQDDDSRQQVDVQKDQWDVRTVRLMFRGRVKFAHPVDYFVSLEVKGRDHVQDESSKLGFTDFEISTGVGALGTLHYGKVKEPFVYEMVGDAANLPQQERALNPFFTSRGIGLRLNKPFANQSMTYAVGWFNDWWVQDQDFHDSGNDFAARLTAVPHWAKDGADYLHVGVSARYIGADEGTVRFKGRPESNVTDYYVDSGSLTAAHANELSFEGLWNHGPLSVTGDYARAWTNAADSGDPRFWGASGTVSYVLTGEHRQYDKTVGYARRILPQREWGAWELVGRYSHVDVTDRRVDGGVFDRETLGLSWWATRRWKVGFDYGLISLNRNGVIGLTSAFHTRFQWVY